MINIFKTSVKNQRDINLVKPHLNELAGISKWNFDLEDCDKILRVESEIKNDFTIIKILQDSGFECEELPD